VRELLQGLVEVAPSPRPQQAASPSDVPGVTRPFNYNELIGKHGGLAALHFAAREGSAWQERF